MRRSTPSTAQAAAMDSGRSREAGEVPFFAFIENADAVHRNSRAFQDAGDRVIVVIMAMHGGGCPTWAVVLRL